MLDSTPETSKQSPTVDSSVKHFSYHGKGTELGLLILKNIFLTLITLGIYYPWGKTAVRKYLWSHSSFDGHRFEYTGTGEEIFVGYLKALGVYFIYFVLTTMTQSIPELNIIVSLLFLIFIGILFPYLIFGSHRYKMSRTKLRGIPFRVDVAKQNDFVLECYRGVFLSGITLGIYAPVFYFKIHKGLVNASRYGNKEFFQKALTKTDWVISITNFFGIIFSFYLFTPWAIVRKMKYRLSHIHIDKGTLQTTMTGLGLAGVLLVSVLATVLTFGLAAPWITTMITAYSLKNLSLVGSINFDEIERASSAGSATGDAGADFMDIDAGVF